MNQNGDFWGRKGAGCSHCERGVAMAWFNTRGHVVALCISCLLEWFPGKKAAWLEERLSDYMDHVDYKLAVALAKQTGDPVPSRTSFVRRPRRDEVTGRWHDGTSGDSTRRGKVK